MQRMMSGEEITLSGEKRGQEQKRGGNLLIIFDYLTVISYTLFLSGRIAEEHRYYNASTIVRVFWVGHGSL